MPVQQALILFAHGARDPRWAEPFERLRDLLRRQLENIPVELAYLELMAPDLSTAMQALIDRGHASLTVVPVFLGQGGHIRRDLPALIEQMRAAHPQISIRCATPVGEDEGVLQAIAAYCAAQLGGH